MQATGPLSFIIISLGLLSTGVLAQNGERFCAGGAISCEYPKGRCAKLCDAQYGFYGTNCSCPDGQDDNPFTGASCIDIIRAAGRHHCTT